MDQNCTPMINVHHESNSDPDSKVHGAIMGPTWVLSAPDGPHVGPMNLTIRGAHKRDTIPSLVDEQWGVAREGLIINWPCCYSLDVPSICTIID